MSIELLQRSIWIIMLFGSLWAMRTWYGKQLPRAFQAWALGGIANLSLLGACGVIIVNNGVGILLLVMLMLSLWGMAMPVKGNKINVAE